MALPFFKHFVKSQVTNFQRGLMDILVGFDPETAGEAEIAQLDEALTKFTQQMVEAKKSWETEQHEADTIQANYNQRLAAADRLQAMIDEESDPTKRQNIEKTLENLLGELEKMKEDVDRETAEAGDAKEYFDELSSAVKSAAERLKSAKANIENAKRKMATAEVRLERAREQEERTKILAGIKQDSSQIGSALDAMKRRADQMDQQAESSKIKTDLLKSPSATDDPILKQALSDVSDQPAKMSSQERLAALKKKSS